MPLYTAQPIGYTGANVTFTAPDVFPSINGLAGPSDHQFLWAKNTDGSPHDVIIVVPGNNFAGQAHTDVTVSVPAGGERLIGPLDSKLEDPAAGILFVLTNITGMTCALVVLPTPPADLP